MTEKEAHDVILAWCRKDRGDGKNPVMREHNGEHRVVDCSRTEKDPNGKYDWERRTLYYAKGASWIECANQLGLVKS